MQTKRCQSGLAVSLVPLACWLGACAGTPRATDVLARTNPAQQGPSAVSAAAAPAAATATATATATGTEPESTPVIVPERQAAADEGTRSPKTPAEPAPLPVGSRVLHVGDSFADALGRDLSKLLRAAGVHSALEFKTASYIPNWSHNGDIEKFLAQHHPDLVLITLGANEIEIPHPEDRARPIKHLVSLLGGRPCVWIGPPLWKPDSGVIAVIRDNVAPCRFLDSSALVPNLPRGPDKIHPSKEGRKIWAKAVFDWLVRERVPNAERPWTLKPAPAQ